MTESTLRTKLRHFTARRVIAFTILIQIPLLSAGCYGSFPLTNALYKANGNITGNTIIHSIIMVILSIFGVYGICMLVDAIVLNSIEFWSGDDMELSQSYEQPDGSIATIAPGSAPNEAVITVEKEGEVLVVRTMVRDDNGITTIHDESGKSLGTVRPMETGGFLMTDKDGNERMLTEQWIAKLGG